MPAAEVVTMQYSRVRQQLVQDANPKGDKLMFYQKVGITGHISLTAEPLAIICESVKTDQYPNEITPHRELIVRSWPVRCSWAIKCCASSPNRIP